MAPAETDRIDPSSLRCGEEIISPFLRRRMAEPIRRLRFWSDLVDRAFQEPYYPAPPFDVSRRA